MPSYSDVVQHTPPFSELDANQIPYRKCDSEQLKPKIVHAFRTFLKRKSSQKQGYFKKFDFMNIFQEKWNKKSLIKTCRLCQFQYEKKQMAKLCQCDHIFCQQCLVQYMKYKINMMEQIICPDQGCNAILNKNSQIFTALPKALRKKYKKSQLWRQSMSNPNIRICPIETCEEGFINFTAPPFRCHKCKKQFCKQCMMQKHQGDCANSYEQNYRQWKRCPQCRMFIQKLEGCNHIVCKCTYEFCFVCLERWNQTHYQCVDVWQLQFFDVQQTENPKLLRIILIILLPIFFILGIIIVMILFVVMIGAGVFIGMFAIVGATFSYLCCLAVVLAPIGMIGGAFAMPIYFTVQVSIPAFRRALRRYMTTIRMLNQHQVRQRRQQLRQQNLFQNVELQQPI